MTREAQPMKTTAIVPHCILEVWDTASKTWVPTTARHDTIASATAAARERGVYRVVVVSGDRRLDTEPFAIV